MTRSVDAIREKHEADKRFWIAHPALMQNVDPNIDTLLAEVDRLRVLLGEVTAGMVDQGDAMSDEIDRLHNELATARADGFQAGAKAMRQRCAQVVKGEADWMGYRAADNAISAINSLLIISEEDTAKLPLPKDTKGD